MTVTLPLPLTREDVAALRLADTVTFHRDAADGTNVIRAWLRRDVGDAPAVFTAREQRLFPKPDRERERLREIVTGGWVDGYDWEVRDRTHAQGYVYLGCAQLHATWPTLAATLRVGDLPLLWWVADNNNELYRDAGWHADELRLCFTRGDRKHVYTVAYRVGPDNSARMIRRTT